MNLVKIANEFYVNPSDVVSVEPSFEANFGSLSNEEGITTFYGSVVSFRCGCKIYVADTRPDSIIDLLNGLGEEEP